MIRLKATDFKRFSKYFYNYFLLLYLYFTSTLLLPYLYIIPTNHLPHLYTQKALGLQHVPTVGMLCSQPGNTIFPPWEQFFHLMEILTIVSLRTTQQRHTLLLLIDNWQKISRGEVEAKQRQNRCTISAKPLILCNIHTFQQRQTQINQ